MSDIDVELAESTLGRGRRVDVVVRNRGRDAVTADDVRIPLDDVRVSHVLEHGWQSWSVVRRCEPDDVVAQRAELPEWVRATYAAVPEWLGTRVVADQFLVHDRGVAGWLDGQRHTGTFEIDADGRVVAVALLDGVRLDPGESRVLDPLWIAEGTPGPLYSAYASHWGEVAGGRVHADAPLGWCSWYQYFPDVTPADVRSNLALAAEHGIELVQIDDGYQAAIGDWLSPWRGWEEGVGALASDIRDAGCRAGIWTAPFLASEASEVLRTHPDWGRGRAWFNGAENWARWSHALDTTRGDVLDWLRDTFGALRDEGFDYFKIDFCFAGARASDSMTRAQGLRAGLEAVRDGIGDDAFLLGCGCPFGPAVGVVDAMRVSADVAPVWEPEVWWPGLVETVPSARNAVMADVLRAPLHRRLWVNDPDCALLRSTSTQLTAPQRRALADTIAGTGGFTVVSDDLTTYGDAEWAELERLRTLRATVDTPLDIEDPFADAVVLRGRGGHALEVRWPELDVRLTP